jgi:hypothetical protein
MQTILFNYRQLTSAFALQCYFKGGATRAINHVLVASMRCEEGWESSEFAGKP